MRPMAPSTPVDRLAAELRRVDYDRYLCALFASPGPRAGMIALYAFSHEVAKISEVVSEPMLGEIRLQWWREAIDGIYDGVARRHDAVEALAEQQSDEVVPTLLSGWRGLSPPIRRSVVDSIMPRPTRIQLLLLAVKAGSIKRSDIERDKKQLLLKHPNAAVRDLSQELFAGEVNSDRARVVAQYQGVLELEGNAVRGLDVFKKKCAVCHQVGEVGHQIAPNLSSVQNKSEADLLLAVLDPNREAQPNFNVYTVVTGEGRILNGIITAETVNSLTLRRAESKRDVVLRSNIDELLSTGLSLMPEGLEKELNRQQLADVIAFIKSIKPPAK